VRGTDADRDQHGEDLEVNAEAVGVRESEKLGLEPAELSGRPSS
jgi:hypothetical protein